MMTDSASWEDQEFIAPPPPSPPASDSASVAEETDLTALASALAAASATDVPDSGLSIKSSRWTPGWKVSGTYPRALFVDRGQVGSRDQRKYYEKRKPSKRGKKTKMPTELPTAPAYVDKRFSPWQNELSAAIHKGDHVIVDVATSCGKTWASNLIVTYETLRDRDSEDEDPTCIFVSPNSEIMRSNVADIRAHNDKIYLTDKRMIDTQTRSYCTYDERLPPHAQIICTTADNFVSFVTNELNHSFIERLKYIVFDEVHLNEVSASMWWSSLLPQTAQFILLSATLGDVEEATASLAKISPTHSITVIKYEIRPIPLQYALFKGCPPSTEGYRDSKMKAAGRISCQINPYDPTVRDMMVTMRDLPSSSAASGVTAIPKERTDQFTAGQKLMNEVPIDWIAADMQHSIDEAATEATPENILTLLNYLFSNGMCPAIVFHTQSSAVQELAKGLVAKMAEAEMNDPDYRKALRFQNRMDKMDKRDRDEAKDDDPFGHASKIMRAAKAGGADAKAELAHDDDDGEDKAKMMMALQKWKFPSQFGEIPDRIPLWIQSCLEYGIGVYIHSMPSWLKYKIFDAFKDGKLSVILADMSVSVGVNLPVRTCILCGDITPTLFRQTGGRAGRFGFDNQGYIVSMFEKERIKDCMLTRSTAVSIELPSSLGCADIARLLTPQELCQFYIPMYKTDPLEPAAVKTTDSPILKEIILSNYLSRCGPSAHERALHQISAIKAGSWHSHRLTNMIRCMPFEETMLFMSLLSDGHLEDMTLEFLIKLVCFLFERRPPTDESDILEFPEELAATIVKYQHHLKIGDDDLSVPTSRYFERFLETGDCLVSDLDRIAHIGEWIYMLIRQSNGLSPTHDKKGRGAGRTDTVKYRVVPEGGFLDAINALDRLFLIASKKVGLV